MRLREIEVNFSFTDADDIEKLEKGMEVVKNKTIEYENKEINLSDTIRNECKVLEEFFDNVFGEGISEKLFEGRMDLKEHTELFMEIANEKIRQTRGMQELYNNLQYKNKYMPNREYRRNNKYKR
jgi:hypothetical protein|nr:MAG TPA: hypothetical protein [Caudoviricetes sp.]